VRHIRYWALHGAVARMTEAARSEGKNALIMTVSEWRDLILRERTDGVVGLGREIMNLAGDRESVEEKNKWLALAMDIWNAMPETARRLDLRRLGLSAHDTLNRSVTLREVPMAVADRSGGLTGTRTVS
jgi:hypothetical protein